MQETFDFSCENWYFFQRFYVNVTISDTVFPIQTVSSCTALHGKDLSKSKSEMHCICMFMKKGS